MGEKFYQPKLGEREHLIPSKENPTRLRGLSRDEHNQNPGIPEWEEIDVEDIVKQYHEEHGYEHEAFQYEQYYEKQEELSTEEKQLAQAIGAALAVFAIYITHEFVVPWWRKSMWPWICNKGEDIKNFFTKKKKDTLNTDEKNNENQISNSQVFNVLGQVDTAFEKVYIDMDEKEIQQHILNIVYHMFELANEIRILSNARIKDTCETDVIYLENKRTMEKLLVDKVASNLDRLLSDKNILTDANISKKIVDLTGGGIYIDGEYAPVEITKIKDALQIKDYEL